MFEEIELPGIGKKYIVKTSDYEVQIIVHESGIKEIYFIKDDNVIFDVSLTSEEAKKIGLILNEAFYKTIVSDRMEYITKQVIFEWIKIKKDSFFINKTILELEVRKKTGASIIGVIRDGNFIVNPDPSSLIFQENDIIVAIGNRESLKKMDIYVKKGGVI
jgi:TrkA domain protein